MTNYGMSAYFWQCGATHMQTFMRGCILSHQKAGRSGRFVDVMMMSPGRGLEECLECADLKCHPEN